MRKLIIYVWLLFITINLQYSFSQSKLPKVYSGDNDNDVISLGLKFEAANAFNILNAPISKKDWTENRDGLRAKIIEKARISFYSDLPLRYNETKSQKLENYTVKNIYFQTRPNAYATANLYIPDGKGPFPAVVVMMGHSSDAKLANPYQSLGHSLAMNGYVALNIDPWGAGERGTTDGAFEYHGSNLGLSLINVGETLMGMQITDNMRAVDLLCSLPFVDSNNIGATGASGGGNQTTMLAAIDERVKAAVPVVSVGTYQSYIANSNCVCELLTDGLTFTEESSVLGLVAPRALKIINGEKDSNSAFYPQEMLRSYKGAQDIYKFYNQEDKLSHHIFDVHHAYLPEMREAMLGWFDLHLKNEGDGLPKQEKHFSLLPKDDLTVFPKGERYQGVMTTAELCFNKGKLLKQNTLSNKEITTQGKRKELREILRIPQNNLLHAHRLTDSDKWERHILETTNGELIPVLFQAPNKINSEYVIICNTDGKDEISKETIDNELSKGKGVCIVDLWGVGENSSINAKLRKTLPKFFTLSRSALWLGKTTQGIWVNELEVVSNWLQDSYKAQSVSINANKEATIAGLLFSALEDKVDKLTLVDTPLSYLFDKDGNIDHFSLAVHIPDILKWGDLSIAAALSGSDITIVNPVSIAGRQLDEVEIKSYKKEFNHFNALFGKHSSVIFLD